jgi:hypothetical protein
MGQYIEGEIGDILKEIALREVTKLQQRTFTTPAEFAAFEKITKVYAVLKDDLREDLKSELFDKLRDKGVDVT